MKANIYDCKARQVLTWVLLLKGGITSSPGRMKRSWQQRRARNKSRRQNSVSGTKFQAREQKTSPCIGGLYRSGFLFSTRNSLHVRAIWYNFIDPGEQIFEEMTELRILCSQKKWKKSTDSVSFCYQMVKSVVAETWIYSGCSPHQLDNSNIFELPLCLYQLKTAFGKRPSSSLCLMVPVTNSLEKDWVRLRACMNITNTWKCSISFGFLQPAPHKMQTYHLQPGI